MDTNSASVKLTAFASVYGETTRSTDSIENFDELCQAQGLSMGMKMMGAESFTQIDRPIEKCIKECIEKTLATSGLKNDAIDYVIFTTVDKNLKHLNENFILDILGALNFTNCVPVLLSLQQCVSSVSAIDYAAKLLNNPNTENVIVVAFDKVYEEKDRIRSFAFFGDAVTSCLVHTKNEGLALLSYDISLDYQGVLGNDDFKSRREMMVKTLENVFSATDITVQDVTKCFATNLYRPIAQFNVSASGIKGKQLYIKTLKDYGHCGNCDWMMNLEHYQQETGFEKGQKFMVQSFAPGFFAASLFEYDE
jgi:3-oxoacyl-[acyl-carrier-protein] synthase III